jgi:hypothetical protein
MDFWYTMNGVKTGDLNIYINTSDALTLLWKQSGNKGEGWLNGRVKILSSRGYRLIIEGVIGNSFTSDIAIDDIDFIDKSCNIYPTNADPSTIIISTTTRTSRPIRPPSSPYDCNFENDYCNYTINFTGNDFDWRRVQGKRGEVLAGPIDVDHTTGESYGWYIQAPVEDQLLGTRASFQSSIITDGVKCLTFYYYLQTNTPFILNVYSLNVFGGSYWKRTTSQGDFWKLGRTTISGLGSYSVVFELQNNGIGSKNDIIAIDDIQFESGNCKDGSGFDEVCTFTGNNLCGYTFESSLFRWQIYQPSREGTIQKSLLLFDHTTGGFGSGYLYANSTGQTDNRTASIKSPLYPGANMIVGEKCLEFYFFLIGDNTTLNVRSFIPSTNNSNIMWSRNFDHSLYWWKGEVNIKINSDFNILFDAVSGQANSGLVGLDDISMKKESCSR